VITLSDSSLPDLTWQSIIVRQLSSMDARVAPAHGA